MAAALAARPDLARRSIAGGRTALHEAAVAGDPVVVGVLLAAGGDPDRPDDAGETPRDRARAHRRRAALQALDLASASRSVARPDGTSQPPDVDGTWALEHPGAPSDGRPCWVQRVKGSKGLHVFAQAMKPEEPAFPNVETLVAAVAADGSVTPLGGDRAVAVVERNAQGRHVIRWTDGAGVNWIPRPASRRPRRKGASRRSRS